MPLEKYKAAGLLFNSNFLEKTSSGNLSAYRGELVLVEGGIGDAMGHAKPPIDVMRGVALLADDKLKLVIGALDQLESIQSLVDKYKDDFAPDTKVLLFVVNIKSPIQLELAGINFVLIPLVQGMPWNETLDELALEKGDFKGQSAADKVLTLYKEMQGYKPAYPTVTLDQALASTTDVVREVWGAV